MRGGELGKTEPWDKKHHLHRIASISWKRKTSKAFRETERSRRERSTVASNPSISTFDPASRCRRWMSHPRHGTDPSVVTNSRKCLKKWPHVELYLCMRQNIRKSSAAALRPPGCLSRYSLTVTKFLRDLDILRPSMFRCPV